MKNIGVLALQGAVIEHLKILNKFDNVKGHEVRTKEELSKVDALIIPGGESTAIGKLLDDFNMTEPIRNASKSGMPLWGTCAGMILLAKEISNHNRTFLNLMDIKVRRNAYGSQLDSFKTKLKIQAVSETEIPLVFIRAPYIEKTWNDVSVLATVDNNIVACRQNNLLATSFHPELTEDLSFHEYFLSMV